MLPLCRLHLRASSVFGKGERTRNLDPARVDTGGKVDVSEPIASGPSVCEGELGERGQH